MDSLGRLADNLPRNSSSTASLALAEGELTAAFRTSALAITQLLKASQKTSKKAFQAGYSTALADVLEYLQQNLDVNQQASGAEGIAIAQAIDYIEARQEAVRLQGLEADGEDEQQDHPPHASTSAQRPQRSRQTSEHVPQQSLRLAGGPVASTASAPQPPKNNRQPHASTSRLPSAGPSNTQSASRSQQLRSDSAPLRAEAIPSRSTPSAAQTVEEPASSSLPGSPDYRSASDSRDQFTFSCPPSAEDNSTADLPNPGGGTAAQSPLTRLQVRRERDRHHDGRRRGQHHSTSNAAGTKRRWTASLLPEWNAVIGLGTGLDSEHSINLDDEASVPPEHDEEIPSDGEVVGQDDQATNGRTQDKQDVDMDAMGDTYRNDGSSRPVKRVVRR